MAITILFKKQKASLGSVELDASVSEVHSGAVEVTDHPVESGGNISDHARPQAETLTIEGFVSNTPMPAENTPTVQRLAGEVTYSSRSAGDPARAGTAYSQLLDLKDAGDLITVVTAIRSYDDMVITSLSVPRDARTGNGLRFSATLKRVRLVSSQTVAIDKAKPKAILGKKGTPETPAPTKSKSLLKSVKDTGVIQEGADKLNSFLGLR